MNSIVDIFISVRDQFNDHVMFGLGLLLLAGYGLGKAAERFKLPAITGFILAGLVLGDSAAGVVQKNISQYLNLVSQLALGIIAATIGCEFSIVKLKRLGKKIFLITVFQLLATFFLVSSCLIATGLDIFASLLLGAIATATAPAATVAIVQSLRARGIFIDYLYGAVALDDALCVILFSLIFAGVGAGAGGSQNVFRIVLHGLYEISISLAVGMAGGFLVHFLTFRLKLKNQILILAIAALFLVIAVTDKLNLSPLLANMMMGATFINLSPKNHKILDSLLPLTPPLYAAFFAIAGTELDLSSVTNISLLCMGLIYIVMRAAGKYAGVYGGARLAGAPVEIKKWLGLCMLPQAGVAIGLVMFIETSAAVSGGGWIDNDMMNLITGVVLFGVFVNELAGPPLSKYGIVKGALEPKLEPH